MFFSRLISIEGVLQELSHSVPHQAIMWTILAFLSTVLWGTYFSENSITNQIFTFKTMHFKILSAKYQPLCLEHSVFNISYSLCTIICWTSFAHGCNVSFTLFALYQLYDSWSPFLLQNIVIFLHVRSYILLVNFFFMVRFTASHMPCMKWHIHKFPCLG